MAKERVLIVGDVMIDSYMWGNVTRISPEAPVPVVSVTKREKRLGGAANVALNIEAMGATPIICSVLGNDDSSKDFQQIMYQNNMDRRGIVTSDNRMTTMKSRVIGNNMLTNLLYGYTIRRAAGRDAKIYCFLDRNSEEIFRGDRIRAESPINAPASIISLSARVSGWSR